MRYLKVVLIFAVLSILHNAVNGDANEIVQVPSSEINKSPFEGNRFEFLNNNLANQFLKEVTLLTQYNSSQNFSSECTRHLSAIVTAITNGDIWALKFLDSWGKLPSGILWGHLVELGSFDECLQTEHNVAHNGTKDFIRGQYCLTTLPFGEIFKRLFPTLAQIEKINVGICIPRSCEGFQANEIFIQILYRIFNVSISSNIVTEEKCTRSSKLDFDTIDWIAISFFSFVGFLIVCSTIYDGVSKRTGNVPKQVLVSFSLYVNMNNLFRTSSKKSPNIISCLNGIRCMSIIWIIFGHSYMINLLLPNSNSIEIMDWAHTPFSMFLQSGTISVDSFFFLSGLLLIWAGLKEMEKNGGKLNVLLMYLHRYIRLTPIVAAAVLFYVSLFRHMGNGPLWNEFTSPHKLCHETWWATLLYVQNYAAAGKMCLGHTWYLAVDMQLYILSPFFLIPIFKWKKKAIGGVIVIGLLLVACVFTSIVINKFSVFSTTGNLGADTQEMRKIYYATHARTSPWLIGIIFGYFLYNHRDVRIKMPKLIIVGGWFIALILLAAGIFSLYPKVLPGAKPLTTVEGAFYLTFSRIAWPLALSWIVFACVNGYGGVANTFLSWPFWQPMARLSYCMYIIHLMIETINGGRTKVNVHFSDYDVILRFWGDFGITILASIVAYLMFESPMMGIEKVLFGPEEKKDVKNMTVSKEGLCNQL